MVVISVIKVITVTIVRKVRNVGRLRKVITFYWLLGIKMVEIKGVKYRTISDAADEFGISPKTLRQWINDEVIPRPPQIEQGRRVIDHFPPEYMEKARAKIKEYRDRKTAQRRKRGKVKADP